MIIDSKAVFLSYASQDAEAARRICETLRGAGVEVWFDADGGLEHGDEWDAKIRKQIKECVLFIPIISACTQARLEGYFRLEWELAAQRAMSIASGVPFILPVVIDDTREPEALVPDRFRAVQWTKLPGGVVTPEVKARYLKLWSHRVGAVRAGDRGGESGNRGQETGDKGQTRDRSGSGLSPVSRPLSPVSWGAPAVVAALAMVAVAAWFFFGRASSPSSNAKPQPPNSQTPSASPTPTEAQQLVMTAARILDEGDELNRENYFLAEDIVKRAVEKDPSEPLAWALHARLSQMIVWHAIDRSDARLDSMQRQAERARALAPDLLEVRIVSADVQLLMLQDLPGLERDLRALIAREPRNWRLQRTLGMVLRFLDRVDESLQALQRAREFSGGLPMTEADLVNVLLRRGQEDGAEAVLAAALARHQSARLLTFDLFARTQWQGDLATARAAFERWPEWLRHEERGAILAWRTWLWSRDYDKALLAAQALNRDYLRDTFFVGPKAVLSARAHEGAGHAEAARADWRTVIQAADRELATAPADWSPTYWKAWALARLGDSTAAAALCVQLQQRNQLMYGRRSANAMAVATYYGGPAAAPLWATVGRADLALAELRKPLAEDGDEFRITRAMLELDPAFDPLRKEPGFSELLAKAPAPAKAEGKSTLPVSEARRLTLQARALIDDDWLAVRENFRNADDLCERATQLDPLDGEAWSTWSRVAVEMIIRNYDASPQRIEAARSRAERALQLAPDSVEGNLAMALVLRQNQSAKDATQRLRTLLARAPMDARVARALAATLSPPGMRANPEATDIRLHHPAFGGKDPRPLMDEARTMHDSERFAECESLGDRAAAMAPCLEYYRFRLVYPGFSVNDLEAARIALEQTPARLLQEDVFAGLAAYVWLKLEKPDNALAALRRVQRDYLEDIWVTGTKGLIAGRAHALAGRPAAAQAEWNQALKVIEQRLVSRPNDPYLLAEKALLLALVGRKEDAEKTWQLAAELRRWPRGDVGLKRGEILLAEGETEAAINAIVSNLVPVVRGRVFLTVNMIHTNPWFAPVRNDPRVRQMLADGDALIRKFREQPVPPAEKK